MNREEAEGPEKRKRITPLEIVVVIAIVGILAAIAIPQYLGAREKARVAVCDNIYVAMNGEVAGELDSVLASPITACGDDPTPEAIVECALRNHSDEDNPRDRNQRAYTGDPISPEDSCQVHLQALGTNGIRFSQYVRPDSRTSRTFSVVID